MLYIQLVAVWDSGLCRRGAGLVEVESVTDCIHGETQHTAHTTPHLPFPEVPLSRFMAEMREDLPAF